MSVFAANYQKHTRQIPRFLWNFALGRLGRPELANKSTLIILPPVSHSIAECLASIEPARAFPTADSSPTRKSRNFVRLYR
jgi:hypothetical protein